MNSKTRKSMQLVGVFFLGCILFNYPIIALFNIDAFVMGLPLFYIYLFAAWAMLIFLILLITETGRKQNNSDSR
ncbi:MAG: hypothetical protein GY697_12310 [Desulfobacterales bacterium]|nr:hypothetical protein [Desulfobacterales bacterium]